MPEAKEREQVKQTHFHCRDGAELEAKRLAESAGCAVDCARAPGATVYHLRVHATKSQLESARSAWKEAKIPVQDGAPSPPVFTEPLLR